MAQSINPEGQGKQTASTQVVPDPKLNISLYVDGSGSMLGYVQSRDSYYGEALKTLGDILALDRGLRAIKPEVSYFRIGQENPAIDRSGFRQAELPGFYDGTNPGFPEVSSPIHEAIKPPSGDKDLDNLIVIVTDLEQDDGDVTKLTSNLQQHYLNQDKRYAVGVWAVKSEFAGKIYLNNTQGGLQARNYDTTAQTSDRYRPFYVLFVGPTADVAHYFEKIAAKTPDLTNGSQGYLTLFPSDRLTEPLISLNEPKEMGGNLTQPDLITGKGGCGGK
ncbi:MAG: hypothetical protein HC796_02350 [Synechococcaceae cyanobacterium RL_1_2]|nr:hypothetical protein [Synechococcaceae cyanobacterium RL_1_2]